ncbi:carboxypeptidase regulatory-like domain-containing protein [Acinetobacter oleivorans]|uniref:carboxypeptidase regulatory-like domain-containing protein n=1 Tax=Acinetobacter oleivorans TaxID=1148157 RepID=UPI0019004CF0|nr:carboxypeptidase regulatory-like domain-containing protein [Acinetobacter oleivorans]MBJ9738951.1 carboxypeptidase regulatory-like domain-containing protein [Acinetobacter oleivorans]MCU4408775.1 carboxypeptidase regulatory-like domain-containing protein [Acinetobacter oleivorans]
MKVWQKLLLGVGAVIGVNQNSSAAEEQGITWLKTSSDSEIATSLQAISEKEVTLGLYGQTTNNINIDDFLNDEQSTEALVRAAILLKKQQKPTDEIINKILSYQNKDGGFGHLLDWQSNPLDTAWVLLALKQVNFSDTTIISKALNYLASQQRATGAFQVVSLDEYYVSAYALTALTEYLKVYPQYNGIALKTVNYLESKQTSAGKWSENADQLFIDALLNEALHPYRDVNSPARSAFKTEVLGKQASDGSWNEDAYITSIILRSLKAQSTQPINPITSTISFSVIDAETKANISDATISSSTDSASTLTVKSKDDGSILFTDVKAGDYSFTVSKDGFGSLTFQVTLRQGESLNLGQIELTRKANVTSATVQGRVTDKITGQPVVGAVIKLISGSNTLTATTNAEGRYQLTLAQPAAFTLNVAANGYIGVSGSGTAIAGGTFDFSPQLISEQAYIGNVTGKITDSAGTPLSDVSVLKNGMIVGQTDANGQFLLDKTSAGSFTLTFEKTSYQGPSVNINLPAGQTANIGTVQLFAKDPSNPNQTDPALSTGKFEITVVNANGTVIQNPTILAEKLDSNNQVIQRQSFNPPEDASNSKLLAELTTGRWRLTAQHPSYQNGTGTIFTLTANQTQQVQLKLTLLAYELKGTVVDSQTNKVISNANITVYRQDNNQQLYTGKTDVSGNFSAKNLNTDLVKIQVDSTPHLSTTRFFDKQYVEGITANLGEIRLRPLSADTSMPDLKVTATNTVGLTTDQQSLQTTGVLKATIANVGNKAFTKTQNVEILAFADTNNNRIFEEGEIVLGRAELPKGLDIQEGVEVSLQIEGKSLFRDAPIGVWVDSSKQVAERDESNNIRLTSDAVEIRPKQGTLDAEVVWHYGQNPQNPNGILNTGINFTPPVAAPLFDTNGDGVIGQGDKAVIVYIANDGTIKALDGQSGNLIWSSINKFSHNYSFPFVNIADVDNDGRPEVISTSVTDNILYIYNADGTIKRQITWPVGGRNNVTIADIDNDGNPEIIGPSYYYNYKVDTWIKYSNTVLTDYMPVVVADINDDGFKEVIGGQYIVDLKNNKTVTLSNAIATSGTFNSPAIVDINLDGKPEIINVDNGRVTIHSPSGALLLSFNHSLGGRGGSPIIADFDGDGKPDIGIAGGNAYGVFRNDGSLIWSTKTQDGSSNVTGSTVFDFNNDGRSEVVYADEQKLMILDGLTGKEIYTLPNSSATWVEYPIVVDADADGHADIIVGTSGQFGFVSSDGKPYNGIRMISGKNRDWANTRNIWNQFSYHVTNINDDLTVPKNEVNSWEVHNTYRANLLLDQNATAAADPTASYIQVNDQGGLNKADFTVRVGNAGGKRIAKGLPVSFYRITAQQAANGEKGTLLGTALTTKALNGGEYEDVTYSYAGNLADFGEIVIGTNDVGQSNAVKIQEYTETNNIARLSVTGGYESLGLTASLDKASYQASENVQITANVSNLGSFASGATVRHSIYDDANNLIVTLPSYDVSLSAAHQTNDSQSQVLPWSLVGIYSGQYRIQTDLIKQGSVIATANNTLIVQSSASTNGLTDTHIRTDKQQYPVNGLVMLEVQLQNTSSNDLGGAATVLTEVLDSTGQVIFSQTANYPQLAANALKQEQYSLQLSNAKAGTYTVRSTTTSGQQSYTRQTSFNVLNSTQTGLGLVGALSATPNEVPLGDTVLLNLQVQNTGSEVWSNLPLNIRLFKNDDLEPIATLSTTVNQLTQAQTYQQSLGWKTLGQNGDRIVAALTYIASSGQEKPLAQASFKLIQIPVEVELPDYKQVKNQLLVYYNCHAGWHKSVTNWEFGKFKYACFSERENTLKRYLSEIKLETGLNYKITYDPTEFKKLMRSGRFNNYWILGAVEKFQISTNDELRELSFNGESVLFDKGLLNWTNYELLDLVDIRYRGHLLLSKGEMKVHEPVYPTALAALTPTDDSVLAWDLGKNAKITADYDGGYCKGFDKDWIKNIEANVNSKFYICNAQVKYPAIVTADYGDSKPLALSFDLLKSLITDGSTSTNKQQAWKELLKQSLSYQQVDATKRLSYAPKEPVYLSVKLNSNQDTQATIVVQLPQDAQWLGSGTVNNNQVKFTVPLSAITTQNITLPIVLPTNSGTHVIKVNVYNGKDTGATALNSREYRFLVRGVNERIALLDQQISKWRTEVSNWGQIARIKALLTVGKLKTSQRSYDHAIAHYAEAGGAMDHLDNIDFRAARKELDELIRTLQIQWYQNNQ